MWILLRVTGYLRRSGRLPACWRYRDAKMLLERVSSRRMRATRSAQWLYRYKTTVICADLAGCSTRQLVATPIASRGGPLGSVRELILVGYSGDGRGGCRHSATHTNGSMVFHWCGAGGYCIILTDHRQRFVCPGQHRFGCDSTEAVPRADHVIPAVARGFNAIPASYRGLFAAQAPVSQL